MKVRILSVEYKCTTDAVIKTLGSNYIIRTHKQRSRNKRELPFGATIGDAKHWFNAKQPKDLHNV
jgi:hypothetical protein